MNPTNVRLTIPDNVDPTTLMGPTDSLLRRIEGAFDGMVTGLVPIDDMTTMYTSDDAANFLDVFGENTDYVIDPEETLADNFAYLMIYGLDGREYRTPEIVQAIDALLKAGFAGMEAA